MLRDSFPTRTSAQVEVVDVTREVDAIVGASGLAGGLANIAAPHCTCALYVNENESGLVHDVLRVVRELAFREGYRHDRIDDNAAAHVAASLIGSALTLPVEDGRLKLGTWQRVMLLELDGPRSRTILVTVLGG